MGSHPEHDMSVTLALIAPILVHCPQSPDTLIWYPPTLPITPIASVQLTANVLDGIVKLRLVLNGASGVTVIKRTITVPAHSLLVFTSNSDSECHHTDYCDP